MSPFFYLAIFLVYWRFGPSLVPKKGIRRTFFKKGTLLSESAWKDIQFSFSHHRLKTNIFWLPEQAHQFACYLISGPAVTARDDGPPAELRLPLSPLSAGHNAAAAAARGMGWRARWSTCSVSRRPSTFSGPTMSTTDCRRNHNLAHAAGPAHRRRAFSSLK